MFRILLLFCLSMQAFGQSPYKPEHYQFADGLPSDVVFMTLKKDGFLYVATQRGLCLYDGYIFIHSKELTSVCGDIYPKNGKIYGETISTGLFEIDDIYSPKKAIAAVNFQDDIQDNDHYHNVYKDNFGNVWCSDFHFLKYYNTKTNHQNAYRITEPNKHLDLDVSYLETATDVIMATTKGLFLWDKYTDALTKLSDISFSSAVEMGGRFILLSNSGELFTFLPDMHLLKKQQTLPLQSLKIVEGFGNGNEFMLYNQEALFSYNAEKNELEALYSSEDRINHVLYDEVTHIFWLSTQKGLIKLIETNASVQHIALPDTSLKPVNDIIADEKHRVWLVKDSRHLFVIEDQHIKQVYLDEPALNRLSFSGNRLLLATGSGVYLKNQDTTFHKIIPSNTAIKKAVFYDGKYWLIPQYGMIKVYDGETFQELPGYIKNDADFSSINLFNDIEVSTDNQLWLASWMPKDFGISRFSNSEKKFVQISEINGNTDKFVADYFNRVQPLRNGRMIFSAMGGFNIVGPDGKITYWMFSQEYKIATDNIVGVAEDQIGNIWFGCAEGLYQYNLKTDTPIRITKTDGLSSNDITYGFFISDYNELYISNEKTLERVSLDKILNTRLIGELKITAVQINEKNRPLSSNAISLKEKDAKQIYFLFSALNFVRKDKLIYRYKINDQEWHYLGAEPKLTLIKPSSGKYDITIEVGDNLGNWQKKNIVLALNIIPPFYKTNWFLGLLFLSFFMGAHFFNVYLVRQEKEKGELKKRIKDNENKMLRSQMNPHFLFNSLNSINSFIIQNKKKEAERYLTAFSKLMRNILENSRKETISLHQELETIKLYLDLEAVRMENKFDYSIRVAGDIDTHSVQIPPLILQPFLENAIWHGINHKSGTGAIDIDIEYNPRNIEILILTIKDDGVGRNASLRRKQQGNEHQSFGIAITKERLELYASGNIVKITDLFDEFNQPSGTLVTLQIQIQHD